MEKFIPIQLQGDKGRGTKEERDRGICVALGKGMDEWFPSACLVPSQRLSNCGTTSRRAAMQRKATLTMCSEKGAQARMPGGHEGMQ